MKRSVKANSKERKNSMWCEGMKEKNVLLAKGEAELYWNYARKMNRGQSLRALFAE